MNKKSVLRQVPLNYYQRGIKNNLLQYIWHMGKFKTVKNLIIQNPKKILDIGCGSGWFMSKLAREYPSGDFYGVDIYQQAIDYGKKIYENLNFKYADAHNLPFPNNYFDLIICAEVLEHVKNPNRVLYEIRRVLKSDGYSIIEMDSGNTLFRFMWFLWTNFLKGKVWRNAHIQIFNSKKLERAIKKSGFRILKKKNFNLTMAIAFLIKPS